MKTLLIIAASVAVIGIDATSTAAQQRDSLLLRLERRLDSLERVIAEMRAQQRDTTTATDELAALRAAAQQAAAEAGPARQDTTPQSSRTRNLQVLNPEISVTGDIVGNFVSPDGGNRNVSAVPREFEFSFQAALDPYTRTKVFVARHEDFEIAGFPEFHHEEEGEGEEGDAEEEEDGHGFEIEEGYMYWVGLPGGFGAKVGKFRQQIGLYNRWHTHALMDVERPLASTAFLGEDGLIQTGASVTLPAFTLGPATQTFYVEATAGTNEVLFESGNEISYLAHAQSFWDLSPSTYVQVGATGVTGENEEAGLKSRLLGLDFAFRWSPAAQSLYRDFQLKGEWYFAEREFADELETGQGGYAQANYRLNRRWIVGVRGDYLDPFDDEPDIVQVAPSLTFWQSEWVRLRLQYNYLKMDGGGANHTILLQTVWAMGPHKHETY